MTEKAWETYDIVFLSHGFSGDSTKLPGIISQERLLFSLCSCGEENTSEYSG